MNIVFKRMIGFVLSFFPMTGGFLSAQDFGSSARFAQYIRQPLGSYESYRPFGVEAFDTGVPGFVNKASFLKLDAGFLNDVMSREPLALQLEIPVSAQKTLNVSLSYTSVVTDKFEILTASGKKASLKFLTYQGTVQGAPKSLVSLTIFEDELMGIVSDGTGGNYVLGLKNQQQKNGQYIIYNDKDLLIKSNFQCGTSDAIPKKIENPPLPPLQVNASCNLVAVYFECDHQMYQDKGSSIEETVKYTVGLFNEVAHIYENEQINVKISAIKVWDMPDPYNVTKNDVPNRDHFIMTLGSNFPGNIAHLLTTKAIGGGIALIPGRYAISQLVGTYKQYPTYSHDIGIPAHEMGHDLNSRHTHACVWNGNNTPIDDCGSQWLVTNGKDDDNDGVKDELDEASEALACFDNIGNTIPAGGGTIMSYCHLINGIGINFELGFGPQPGNIIRNYVAIDTAFHAIADLTDQACNGGNCAFTLNCVGNPVFTLDCAHDVNYNMAVIQDPDLEMLSQEGQAPEIKDNSESENMPFLTLSPNPFSSELRLRIRMEKEERVSVLLRDLNGVVQLKPVEHVSHAAATHNITLNTSALPPGVYLLEVSSESQKEVKRVVKQ